MQETGSGFSLAWALGIVFVVLKLVGVIAWSWLWVLAPFWLPLAGAGVVLVVFAVIYAAATLLGGSNEKKVRTSGWQGDA